MRDTADKFPLSNLLSNLKSNSLLFFARLTEGIEDMEETWDVRFVIGFWAFVSSLIEQVERGFYFNFLGLLLKANLMAIVTF